MEAHDQGNTPQIPRWQQLSLPGLDGYERKSVKPLLYPGRPRPLAGTMRHVRDSGTTGRGSELPLGDARADDLVDAAVAESDPRRAIGILHQVLRYGRATIYALKAYSELGSCYERLGNRRRALSCYDRALALAEDEPYTHARRGLLLDACGDHAAALIALETSLAALETSPVADAMRLNEEFWEKVERRLHELRQRPV